MQSAELTQLFAQHAGMGEERAQALLELTVAILTAGLQDGQAVEVEGLGAFACTWIPPKVGNPGGRGVIPIPGRWHVRFGASQTLLEALRRGRKAPEAQLWDRPAQER